MRIIGAVFLSLAIALPAEAANLVYIIAGSSNASGMGHYDGSDEGGTAQPPAPAPYNVPQPGIEFWNYAAPGADTINMPGVGTGWVDLQPGYGYKSFEFGPELSFGAELQAEHPNDHIYIIKYAISGSNLGYGWQPMEPNVGPYFTNFMQRVDAALATIPNPVISGMAWMQGESDALVDYRADPYATNLTNFINTVRADLNVPDMRFVDARITYYYDSVPNGDNAIVRAAEVSVPAAMHNVAWIDTDDLPWAYNGHYGTAGQITLGTRFAQAMTALPGDANGDGIVNIADLTDIGSQWLHTGQSVAGDANGDGIVNIADLTDVGSHWQETFAANAAGQSLAMTAVPEPTSVVLLALGLGFLVVCRR